MQVEPILPGTFAVVEKIILSMSNKKMIDLETKVKAIEHNIHNGAIRLPISKCREDIIHFAHYTFTISEVIAF